MICIYRYFSLICKFIYVSVCSSEAVLKCPVTYIPVPVVDVRVTDEDAAKIERSKSKFWGQQKKKGKGKGKKRTKPTKKNSEKKKIRYMQWPVLNPAMLFESMVRAEAFELLQAPGFDWSDFWARAKKEDWGMQHPVHDLSLQARMKSVGITFHGDEGQAKRHRNVLILSWSSIAIHGPSLLTKFPYCVP